MAEHLFLFAINPVQAYIEQARKTQDLYAGSVILSHLCQMAIDATHLPPEQIIFPKIEDSSTVQSLPNRLIAIVKEQDIAGFNGEKEEEKLRAFGDNAEQAVKDAFRAIAETVSEPFKEKIPNNFFEQVECYLQVNWLFLQYQEKEYVTTYPRLERLLKGIKQVRAFQPLPEQGRKCAICGERNVKVFRKKSGERAPRLFTSEVLIVEEKDDTPIKQKFLQPGEGICAVCYMKRSAEAFFEGRYDAAFPSTSHIALFDAINKLPDATRPASRTSYNADLVFELHNNRPKEQLLKEASNAEIQEAEQILQALKDKKIPFGPYYAILHLDGDQMGKWLSGKFLKEPQQLPAFHKQLSARLGTFARWAAQKALQPPHGQAVYAGGDDFLGFVNLANLFTVLRTLREQFDEVVNTPLFTGEKAFTLTEADRRLTFSAGVAVGHYKTPLGEVLKWARQMEHAAKEFDRDQKNAFAIAVLKHSGEICHTVFPWWTEEEESIIVWTTDLFQQVMTPIINEQFSRKFLVNLDQEFRRLINPDKTLTPLRILKPEARRLITRACQMERGPGEDQKAFEAKRTKAITDMTQAVIQLNDRSPDSFENVLAAFKILDFFTRKEKR